MHFGVAHNHLPIPWQLNISLEKPLLQKSSATLIRFQIEFDETALLLFSYFSGFSKFTSSSFGVIVQSHSALINNLAIDALPGRRFTFIKHKLQGVSPYLVSRVDNQLKRAFHTLHMEIPKRGRGHSTGNACKRDLLRSDFAPLSFI